MLSFIQKLTDIILDIQNKLISETVCSGTFMNTTSKKVVSSCATLSITTKTTRAKEKIENNLEKVILSHKNSPEKLLEIVKKNGTEVFKIKNAKNILKMFSQEIGFVSANNGIKGLLINLITSHKISFYSKPLFIIENSELDKYWTIQQVYKWYAMKLNMPGFDRKSQDNFNRFMTNSSNVKIKELSIDEILGIKEAIARDAEAIDFVVKMAKRTESSKKALLKMSLKGATV